MSMCCVHSGLSNSRTKSVKFAERPTLEQLRRQIELVSNCFHYIHTHDGDLDLQLTVTVNTTPSSPVASSSGSGNTPLTSVSSGPMPGGVGSGLPSVDESLLSLNHDDHHTNTSSLSIPTSTAIPAEC